MTLYIACYDLSIPQIEQLAQISYWLDFLSSSLSLPASPIPLDAKWRIMLVGTRVDMQDSSSTPFTLKHLASWKKQWNRLPLHDQLFAVSARSSESVNKLFGAVSQACDSIFTSHARQIPSSYRQKLADIRTSSAGDNVIFTTKDLFNAHGGGMDQPAFFLMLQYFHEIGQIALLKEGLVCTSIQYIAKIAAKFVSPEDVQAHLLNKIEEESDVQILSQENVGFLLDTVAQTQQYVLKNNVQISNEF